MSIKIEFDKEQIESLITVSKIRLEGLNDKILGLEREKSQLISLLKRLEEFGKELGEDPFDYSNQTKEESSEEYSSKFTWPEKLRYILGKSGRCLTANEIFEEILKYEPSSFKTPHSKKSGYRSLTSALSTKINKNEIINRYIIL